MVQFNTFLRMFTLKFILTKFNMALNLKINCDIIVFVNVGGYYIMYFTAFVLFLL